MPQRALIGVGAGLAGAVLFASAAAGATPLGYLLFLLAPLPAFLAGLGWGWPAAFFAGISGAILVAAVSGPWGALIYALTQAAPVVLLCYLISLSRPLAQATASPDGGAMPSAAPVEWYPIGRIVIASALIAGSLSVMSLMIMGGSVDTIRARLKPVVETVITKQLPGFNQRQFTPAEIESLTDIAMTIVPAASAVLWMTGLLLNLWLAGRITLMSGNLARPWPDLAAVEFPTGTALLLAAATAGTFLSGMPGLLSAGFSGALFAAYVLLGLAVVHYVTRGVVWRPFILAGTYAALLVLNTWMSLLFALIGLTEPFAPWRRGRPPPQNPPPPTPNNDT